jgi:hypothetical protein
MVGFHVCTVGVTVRKLSRYSTSCSISLATCSTTCLPLALNDLRLEFFPYKLNYVLLSTCSHANIMLSLFFDFEGGGDLFSRNVC